MNYVIKGEPLPVVICNLNAGEKMKAEGGAMSWMTPNLKMETSAGGLGGALSKMFSGEKIFQNIYTAQNGEGQIAFASSFPGSIRAYEITPGKSIIAQKSAFLASTEGVELSIHFQKKIGAGFFGGEGFIMQKFSGNGTVFLEVDGTAIEYELAAGQQMIVDTGYLAIADDTVSIDVQAVKGVKNVLFGGEGLFNTVLTGPGKIVLQSMPMSQFVGVVASHIPSKN